MIEVICQCTWKWAQSETSPRLGQSCPKCNRNLALACAEALPPGAGGGDFDAYLEIIAGPADRIGQRIHLGGVNELILGRQEGTHLHLPSKLVSRQHAKLQRIDFGPSKWSLQDNQSTHGLFVNDHRVEFRELQDGDIVRLGEYQLRFGHAHEKPNPAALAYAGPAGTTGGIECPSCGAQYPANAKICISCGIKLDTGRPVILSAETDENYVHGTSATFIQLLSWIVWVTPMPIPLISEAFGRCKPWTIRAIATVTVLASLIFLIGSLGSQHDWDVPGKNLELWPPGGTHISEFITKQFKLKPREVRLLIEHMPPDKREEFEAIKDRLRPTVRESDLDRRALEELLKPIIEEKVNDQLGEPGSYQPHQLLTHAFLHDNSSILGCALHLGGNLVFMLVFGGRVNALLGNVATFIIYPILAVGAASAHLLMGHPQGPMLGASGAIMGLAGMYLVLFPVHRVYCAMWFRFRVWCAMKIFVIRGFWVLLIYFAYDAAMIAFGFTSSTAHWAHLGGFLIGLSIALLLLTSRLFNCGGGDLLSVMLGKRSWWLIGRPSRWNKLPAAM